MPVRPDVVALDVNETLTDLSPLRALLVEHGLPGHLLELWFASVLRDGIGLAAAGGYAAFAEVARATMEAVIAAQRAGSDRPAVSGREVADRVVAGFTDLALHPDVEPGLRALTDDGIRVVTLTNGSAQVTRTVLEAAGVADLVEHVLSVEEVRRWKPAREPYEHALQVCGVSPAAMTLVAVHPWDIDGAGRAGLTTAWIRRATAPYPSWARPPDLQARGLDDVAAQLLALPSTGERDRDEQGGR